MNIKKFFSFLNPHEDEEFRFNHIPTKENAKFNLKVDKIKIGTLSSNNGEWYFKYSSQFKSKSDEYNRIIGFPDLDRVYKSEILWPFFQVRIPSLKQPGVKEIIKTENIDQQNEVALLKRFGKKAITSPYELEEV